MSALIFINAEKMSALIFLVRQKWVGVNILGVSALIFLALVTGPVLAGLGIKPPGCCWQVVIIRGGR